MKTILLVGLFSIYLLVSCHNETPNFSPFIGNWSSENGKITEQWQMESDSLYYGKSFSLDENDTLLLESMIIKKVMDSYYYIPQVVAQNEGRKIPFKLMSYTKTQFVFENPNHDFPQRIVYFFSDKSNLLVTIESLDPASTKRVEFKFVKQVQ